VVKEVLLAFYYLSTYMKILSFFIAFFCFFVGYSQIKTTVAGIVIDAKTNEPLEYVNVQFSEGTFGTSSDRTGHFLLETQAKVSKIKVSYIGYETQMITIKTGEKNQLSIKLMPTDATLSEITIRPERYKKKNPAVDLVHQVFLHKDQNRKEGLPYCQFDTYEKLRFDLNGITEKYTKKWYFRPFQYAFTFCDTNKINQKVTFPFYLRERYLTTFLRSAPTAKRERLWAERQTAFDDDYDVDRDGISNYLNNMYSDIDIYAPTITLLDKQFIGPLSSNATSFYRFYITDTIAIDNQRFASLFFSPINKNDLAFMGTMLVALDGSYAIKNIDMGVSKDININWLSEIKIRQGFDFQGDSTNRRLLMNKDELIFDFKIFKNKASGRSLLVTKRDNFIEYKLNLAQADSLYKGKVQLLKDTGNLERTPAYWLEHRKDTFTKKDIGVAMMMDSLKSMRLVKNLSAVGRFLSTGFINLGIFQVGNLNSFLRYNDVEGTRIQLNFRTRDKYFKHYRLRGYAAYGSQDKQWKYGGNITVAFKGARPGRFPLHQLKLAYENDLFFPGLGMNIGQNIFNSVQTSGTNRLLQHKRTFLEYSKENQRGLLYSFNASHKIVQEAGIVAELQNNDNQVITTEVGLWMRYAPNAKFYQQQEQRRAIRTRFPVFDFNYKMSLKDVLGGEYAYQRASLRVEKFFYVAPFGKSRCLVEVGGVFGQVPYQFLEIHPANRSYFFDESSFNLMNYLEFVSDKYTMLHINHNFEGILFNRIPLLKKLHWREGLTFKAVYGILSEKNIPTSTNGLPFFPKDANNQFLTQSLGKFPYMETSLGVGNIFGFLRIDYIRRLNYLSLPNAQSWGIKMLLSVEF
jgi:hypothetical protein